MKRTEVHAEVERQNAWQRRLRRLYKVYHLSFLATACTTLGLCAIGLAQRDSFYLAFVALLAL